MKTPLIATLIVTVCIWCTCTALSECPTSWLRLREHCYYFSTDQMSWRHAEYSCLSKGGHLASIWDREEQSWVRAQMSVSSAWIGLYYSQLSPAQWKWTDNTIYFFLASFWNSGKPSGYLLLRCAEVMSRAEGWDHVSCLKVQPYICKRAVDKTPIPPPRTNWETEICASDPSQSSCSSNDITCSCLLAMFANPNGGFKAALDHGLSVNRSIVIRGRANPSAERLIVNVRMYDSDDADGDNPTALRLAFHFEGGTIVLNSHLSNSWGEPQTEDFAEQCPFGAGLDFKIVILCDADAFRLTFNDMQQLDYKYQVQDLQSIKWLEVWYAQLTGIQLM
ncbi:neurocan core protein-like [Hippocampus comes]|uniref:Galectin n=1 Tax=Hippocampus comes TaxID=109280 RepID=A0A3Q2YL75_HIPCM|nr:PREDICTED: neurocan core protein-like [Hippocampus comes]